jgi:hypothetical protein
MHYPYPTMEQTAEQWPVARQLLTGDPPDLPEGIKAGHVVLGYGFSIYPGEPGTFASAEAVAEAPANYGVDDVVRDLDEHFAEPKFAGTEAGLLTRALPWQIIIPLLMAEIERRIREWLANRN